MVYNLKSITHSTYFIKKCWLGTTLFYVKVFPCQFVGQWSCNVPGTNQNNEVSEQVPVYEVTNATRPTRTLHNT